MIISVVQRSHVLNIAKLNLLIELYM